MLLPLFGILGLAALLLLPGLGAAPLERAEIYFLDVARSMVERGDYLVPHYRGQPFFDKPGLTYWLMALSFHALGFTPAAARLVSVVAALLALSSTLWLGAQLFDRRTAAYGGVILATTLGFVGFGRLGMSDMLLAFWSTLAMALAVAAFRDGGARGWPVPVLGAVLGLGFQTKGPVALLLPGLGILGLLWQRRRERWPLTVTRLSLAAALFAVFGLAWFGAVYRELGAAPLAHFFLRENLERFAGETYDVGRAWWFYLRAYPAVGLPWSLLLPLAGWHALRRGEDGGHDRLLLAWMGLIVLLLSLSRGKIDYYLLPALPAASLLVARHVAAVPWGRLDRAWGRVVLVLLGSTVAGLPALAWWVPRAWLPGPPVLLALSVLLLGGGLACFLVARFPTPPRTLGVVAGVAALVFVSLGAVLLPAFRATQPHHAVVEDVMRERRRRPDAALVYCEDRAQLRRDLLFHVRVVARRDCESTALASREPVLRLLEPGERASLAAVPGLREVGEYPYLPASALTLRGFLAGLRPSGVGLVANYPGEPGQR